MGRSPSVCVVEPEREPNLGRRWALLVSLITLPVLVAAIAVAVLVSVPLGLMSIGIVILGAAVFMRLGLRLVASTSSAESSSC